jgi:hypothetical protein
MTASEAPPHNVEKPSCGSASLGQRCLAPLRGADIFYGLTDSLLHLSQVRP